VVYLNKADTVDDKELLELVSGGEGAVVEVRVSRGQDPIIIGSALKALEAKTVTLGEVNLQAR